MKILVLGSGGVGGYFGGRLLQAGADVFFVARGQHLEALQSSGLKLTSVNGDFSAPQVNASADPADAGKVDVIMHCTKGWDLERAMHSALPTVDPHTLVIPFQNGIDNLERLTKIVPAKQLAGGIAYGVVHLASPGHIDHASKDLHALIFGPTAETKPAVRPFLEWCQRANFTSTYSESIMSDLWKKFIFICAYSGVTSLTRSTIGPIVDTAETMALYRGCMQEIASLAEAKAIELPSDWVENRCQFSRNLEKTAKSSMQRDLELGNRLELESLNGTVARLGRLHHIPTPINDFIYAALKLHSMGLTPELKR